LIVQPQIGSTGFLQRSRDSWQLLPRLFLVEELAIGEDATSHVDIPSVGSEVTIGGYKVTCDWVGVTTVLSDNSCYVEARYSSDRRFSFPDRPADPNDEEYQGSDDHGYKKTTINVPQFSKGERTYKDASGATVTTPWWHREDIPLDIELRTYNVQIRLTNQTRTSRRLIINTIDSKIGQLHRFGGRDWIFQPATVRSNRDDIVDISYAWVSDPGNGELEYPAAAMPGEFIVADMERPPFHVYTVIPQSSTRPAPVIFVQNLFAAGSRRIVPDGYEGLPGDPI